MININVNSSIGTNSNVFLQNLLRELKTFDHTSKTIQEWNSYLSEKLSLGKQVNFETSLTQGLDNDKKKEIYNELKELRKKFLRK